MKIVDAVYYDGSGQVGVIIEGHGEILIGPFGKKPSDPDGELTEKEIIGYHILQLDHVIEDLSLKTSVSPATVEEAVREFNARNQDRT